MEQAGPEGSRHGHTGQKQQLSPVRTARCSKLRLLWESAERTQTRSTQQAGTGHNQRIKSHWVSRCIAGDTCLSLLPARGRPFLLWAPSWVSCRFQVPLAMSGAKGELPSQHTPEEQEQDVCARQRRREHRRPMIRFLSASEQLEAAKAGGSQSRKLELWGHAW